MCLKRPRRWSSHRGEPSEAPADLVERDFHAGAPNRLWPTDATRSAMDGHKRRPSPVIDRFDGMVVSRRLSRSPDTAMADGMPLDAIATPAPGETPTAHSDRGRRHRRPGWIRIRGEHGLVRSMSAKGRGPDNAAAEGFLGRPRNEFLHCRDRKDATYDELHGRPAAYLTHYHETRTKKSPGRQSPVQYRRSLGLAARPSKKTSTPPPHTLSVRFAAWRPRRRRLTR
ncbi:DDE-type integrase/transposase/recombinase [Bifidobacterium pullorum subsp. saeculare]|uniref:DDE-type integrase/transposase/recombinase n=1 Tax=Bifidobacterium pullorum subsp. saeculare TaxID=78257 RepID=A0A938WZB1_9BIFI|nr:DDE-type integrase/transposase/recombinase [Bifidobacterium pullorum subsp. saeculare]